MPEDCFTCQLKEEGFCNLTNELANDICKRNNDCPLIPLPEHHGRLIDADKMKQNRHMGDDCNNCPMDWKTCHYIRGFAKEDFCIWIDDEPTVVEAE